jgi:multisubunit Na+/H+ antiporter MnhG subunit
MGKFLTEVVGLIPELFKKEEAWLLVFILALGGLFSFSFFQTSLGIWDVPAILWRFIAATKRRRFMGASKIRVGVFIV